MATPENPSPIPPPSGPEKPLVGVEQIVDELGEKEKASPDVVARAKAHFLEGKRKETPVTVTRTALNELAGQIRGNESLKANDQYAVNRLIFIAEQAIAMESFKHRVLFGENEHDPAHDFMGNDSGAVETEANPVFQKACEVMQTKVLGSVKMNWPAQYRSEWISFATDFMVKEIANWEGIFTRRMAEEDVEQAVDKLFNPKLSRIGHFEEWFKAHHKAEFDAWQLGLAELKTKKDAFAKTKIPDAKTALGEIASLPAMKAKFDTLTGQISAEEGPENLAKYETEIAALVALGAAIKPMRERVAKIKARASALPQTLVPTQLGEEIGTEQGKIESLASDNPAAYEAALGSLEARVGALESVKAAAEGSDIPQEEKDKIFNKVKEGGNPADAERELAAAKKAAEEAADENMPWGDKMFAQLEKMPDGAWKSTLTKLLEFGAFLATVPLIGGWIRGKYMSNKLLAEKFGDKQAVAGLRIESEFRKFGLPADAANDLGGKKTKDVIAQIRDKPTEISDDAGVQAKLGVLRAQLESKGGATSEKPLIEFMNPAAGWTGIAYGAQKAQENPAPAAEPEKKPETPVASVDTKLNLIFADMTPDNRTALENASVRDVALGTLPESVKDGTRAKAIAAKLKEYGADKLEGANLGKTVKAFIEDPANIDKSWA